MADPMEQKARERFEKWAAQWFSGRLEWQPLPGCYADMNACCAYRGWCEAERSVVSDIVGTMQLRADTLGHPSFDYVRAFVELRRLIAELSKEYEL